MLSLDDDGRNTDIIWKKRRWADNLSRVTVTVLKICQPWVAPHLPSGCHPRIDVMLSLLTPFREKGREVYIYIN